MFPLSNLLNVQNQKFTINSKVRGAAVFVTILCLFIYLTIVLGIKNRTERHLKHEKLNSDFLLLEKTTACKKIVDLQKNIDELRKRSTWAIESVQVEYSVLSKNMALLKKEQLGLQKVVNQHIVSNLHLESKVKTDFARMTLEIAAWKMRYSELEDGIAESNERNQKYLSEIDRIDQSKVRSIALETLGLNRKLTTRASKAKYIKVDIEISGQAKDLSFRIIDPHGKEVRLNPANFSIKENEIKILKSKQAFYVNPVIELTALEGQKKVEMMYFSHKLYSGTYQIFVSTMNDEVACVKTRLR